MTTKRKTTTPPHKGAEILPQFCDYSCAYAEFARPDAVGACRRDLGVYCRKFRKYHTKNAPCLGRS